ALAAILGAIDAALAVRPEDVAQHGGIDQVGIGRMNANTPDKLAVPESDVAPGAAGVGRFVHAVAVGDVEADRGLAGAGVDHVGIGRRHCDRADRRAAHETVRHAAPEHAAVDRLPDAAGAGAEIERHPVHGIARYRDHAAAARRTDAAPSQSIES